MSISTHINFYNERDPQFLLQTSSPEGRKTWEEDNGPVSDRPGAMIEDDSQDAIEETSDEYGGWVINVAAIPKNATHIVIYRC